MLPFPIWNPTPLTVTAEKVTFPGESAPIYRDPSGVPVATTEWDLPFIQEEGPGNAIQATAQLQLGVVEPFAPLVQVQWFFWGVYDILLVDAFEDEACVASSLLEATGRVDFLGGPGNLHAKFDTNQENGERIVATALTNILSPAGKGGEAMFRNAYLQLAAESPGVVKLTPVVDDTPVPTAARYVLLSGSISEPEFQEFEIPLIDLSQPTTKGLRGGWIRFQLEATSLYDCGRFLVGGLELEYEAVRLGAIYRTFGELPVGPNPFVDARRDCLGFDGRIGIASGTTDLGSPFDILSKSNVLAPEGVGGECMFKNFYFTIYRANTAEVQVEFVPIIDDGLKEPFVATLAAVTGDPVEEVYEIPLVEPNEVNSVEVGTNAMRGTWFQLGITVSNDPVGPVEIMGLEVEYETVRETTKAV